MTEHHRMYHIDYRKKKQYTVKQPNRILTKISTTIPQNLFMILYNKKAIELAILIKAREHSEVPHAQPLTSITRWCGSCLNGDMQIRNTSEKARMVNARIEER